MHVTWEKCNQSAFILSWAKLFCLSFILVDVSQHCSSWGALPSLADISFRDAQETLTWILGLNIQQLETAVLCQSVNHQNIQLVRESSSPEL